MSARNFQIRSTASSEKFPNRASARIQLGFVVFFPLEEVEATLDAEVAPNMIEDAGCVHGGTRCSQQCHQRASISLTTTSPPIRCKAVAALSAMLSSASSPT